MTGYVVNTASGLVLSAYAPSAEWAGLYDKLRFFRQTNADVLEELTSTTYKAARIPSDAQDRPSTPVTGPLVYIGGEKLSLAAPTAFEIDFDGSDPLTMAEVAEHIDQNGLGKVTAYVTEDGQLVIETTLVGTQAFLSLTPTDGATKLGLPSVTTMAIGKDVRPSLLFDAAVYTIIDPYGSREYDYFYQYFNSENESISDIKPLVPTKGGALLSSDIALGFLQLNSLSGMPVANREIIIEVLGIVAVGSGSTISLVAGERISAFTDQEGKTSVPLVRGSIISLMIAGTGLVYKVTTPSDISVLIFNLLDPAYASFDNTYFKVREPNIPFAARRSP